MSDKNRKANRNDESDIEDSYEDDNIEDKYDDRREFRRKRRARSQLMAYIAVVVFLCLVAAAGFLVISKLKSIYDEYASQKMAASQASSEAVTIAAPDSAATYATASPDELLDQIVSTCISEMPLEDKVAGLFIITPEQLTGVDNAVQAGSGTQEALSTYAVGGLIYSSANIKSQDQITQMLSDTTSMSKYPLFMCLNEEGGASSPLASAIGTNKASGASDLGSLGDAQAAIDAGDSIGSYMAECGFNMDFAPVVNLTADSDSDETKAREYGSDSELVSNLGSAFAGGLEESGVSACMKYFPVIGSSSDSQSGSSEMTLDGMRESVFKPFQSGISINVDAIMLSNSSAPNATGDNTPCSLSEVMATDILKNELGYQGIIITDDLSDKTITDNYSADKAAIAAIEAGADMILNPEDFETAYTGLLTAVQDGTISEDRINESLTRIYRIKYAGKVSSITAENGLATSDASNSASTDSSLDASNSGSMSSDGSSSNEGSEEASE